MTTNTTAEVFLGHSIDVASEQEFLARLQRDLCERGVRCRVLGNLQLGQRIVRQIDFLVICEHRTVLVELKMFGGPVVAAPMNGDWQVRVGEAQVAGFGNPGRQAQDATYALSDALHAFARRAGAPGPSDRKFFRDIDTVVCAFPALANGSCEAQGPHVTLMGYARLLEFLQQPGRHLPWSDADWDAFGRDLNLYRADDASPEGLVRRAGAAAVDEYCGRYLAAAGDLPPVVETAVRVDDVDGQRPALDEALTQGCAVLLHGPSGYGKTLWARSASIDLARAGNVPIWLSSEIREKSFRTSLARAVSPYTSMSATELLRAAEAAGRTVVFIIDDITKAPADDRRELLDGTKAVALRRPTSGLLITGQAADAADSIGSIVRVELLGPSDSERQAVLDAYGAADIIDRCDGFTTPMELWLAATHAATLPAGATAAELLDLHVDHVTGSDAGLRHALRKVARQMHDGVAPTLARTEVARVLQRDGASDAQIEALWSCPLLRAAHGRVFFSHERFEQFLMAEAVLIDNNDETLAQTLNTPRYAALRGDVIALEADERRLGEILLACEDPDTFVAGADGRLGYRAARLTESVLTDAINVACALTTADGITFDPGDDLVGVGVWSVPATLSKVHRAQLVAAGQLLGNDRFVDGCARLLDLTDALCERLAGQATAATPGYRDRMFATTYVFHHRRDLPASTVATAATESAMRRRVDATRATSVALELLRDREDHQLGRLYVAAELLRRGVATPAVADVVEACLQAGRYHLTLAGLDLAEMQARRLEGDARERVLEAVRAVPTDNIMLNGSIIDALSTLGDVEPANAEGDIIREIEIVLGMQHEPIAKRMAYGIFAAQFESEAIGPYYQVVSTLPADDRQRLLAMALDGYDTDGFCMDWIMGEIDDLDDPFVRSAVERYVARADPSGWGNPQSAIEATVAALGLMAAAGVPLPDAQNPGAAEPAWRASLTLLLSMFDSPAGQPVDEAWAEIVDDQPQILASLLHNLHRMHLRGTEQVHRTLIAAMPAAGVAVLTWSVEHPEKLQVIGHDYGLRGYLVSLLGDVGDHRAADTLRRFVDDPEIGAAAVAAVRAIETRGIA